MYVLESLHEGYNEVMEMNEFKARLWLSGTTKLEEIVLKTCSEFRFLESNNNFLLIISISVGTLTFVGIILTIAFIMKRRYDNRVEVDVNPDYGIEDQYGNYYAESNIAEGYEDYEQ